MFVPQEAQIYGLERNKRQEVGEPGCSDKGGHRGIVKSRVDGVDMEQRQFDGIGEEDEGQTMERRDGNPDSEGGRRQFDGIEEDGGHAMDSDMGPRQFDGIGEEQRDGNPDEWRLLRSDMEQRQMWVKSLNRGMKTSMVQAFTG